MYNTPMTADEEEQLVQHLYSLTDEELLAFQENLMDIIIEKKMSSNKIVFSGVENGLLN